MNLDWKELADGVAVVDADCNAMAVTEYSARMYTKLSYIYSISSISY